VYAYSLEPISLLSYGYRSSFPEVKWQGLEVDHSPPFSAELRMSGNIHQLPLGAFVASIGRLYICEYLHPYS
jgi:hypothetical protein